MVNYNNGKIYKIEDVAGETCYIGSTTKDYLSKRMVEHRSMYKRWKESGIGNKCAVFNIFDQYDVENCRIVLVELCPCDSKDELLKREAYYINTTECVNKNRPMRTQEEGVEYHKQYYENNKEKLQFNHTEYYKKHKLYIDTQNAIKHICKCGSTFTKQNYTRHKETAKHQNYIANQPIDI